MSLLSAYSRISQSGCPAAMAMEDRVTFGVLVYMMPAQSPTDDGFFFTRSPERTSEQRVLFQEASPAIRTSAGARADRMVGPYHRC